MRSNESIPSIPSTMDLTIAREKQHISTVFAQPNSTPTITILEAHPKTKLYAKATTKKITLKSRRPFYNRVHLIHLDSPTPLSQLAQIYSQLLTRPYCTQIMGAPDPESAIATVARVSPSAPTPQSPNSPAQHVNLQSTVEPTVKSKQLVRRTSINFPDHNTHILAMDIDKFPLNSLPNELANPYRELRLTDDRVTDIVNYIVQTYLPSDFHEVSYIYRLSSSFLSLTQDPTPKPIPTLSFHLIFLMYQPEDIETLRQYLEALNINLAEEYPTLFNEKSAFVDLSTYRSPVNILYTSAPVVFPDAPPDPLSFNMDGLSRVRLVKSDSGLSLLSLAPGKLLSRVRRKYGHRVRHSGNFTPAWQKSGVRGLWNRNSTYTIEKWLAAHEYYPTDIPGRWTYAEASGGPGTLVTDDGHVIDYHENSPIKQLLSSSTQRPLDTYDLYKATVASPEFAKLTDKFKITDKSFQRYWYNKIVRDMAWLTTITSEDLDDTLDNIIRGLLGDMVRAFLTREKVYDLCKEISAHVRELKLGVSRRVLDLIKMYREERREYFNSETDIIPDNTVTQNAEIFLNNTLFAYPPNPQDRFIYFYEDQYEILTRCLSKNEMIDLAQLKLTTYLKSDVSVDWKIRAIDEIANMAVRHLRSREVTSQVKFCPEAFKFTQSDMYFDTRTGEILPHTNAIGNLYTLPFTYKQYEQVANRFEDTFPETRLYKFLEESLSAPEKQEAIRIFIGNLFDISRPKYHVLFLRGMSQTGKSVLVNLVSALLPTGNQCHTNLDSFARTFGQANITPHTLLTVINELPPLTPGTKLNTFIQKVKEISGGDTIEIDRKFQEQESVKPITGIVMTTNSPPVFEDRALLNRLLPVFMDNRVSNDKLDTNLITKLRKELPYLFHWVITHPTYSQRDRWKVVDKLLTKDKYRLSIETNPKSTFLTKYLRPSLKEQLPLMDIRKYFSIFSEQEMDEGDISELSPITLKDIRATFPDVTYARRLSKPYSRNQAGFTGITWRDEAKMKQELNEFDQL